MRERGPACGRSRSDEDRVGGSACAPRHAGGTADTRTGVSRRSGRSRERSPAPGPTCRRSRGDEDGAGGSVRAAPRRAAQAELGPGGVSPIRPDEGAEPGAGPGVPAIARRRGRCRGKRARRSAPRRRNSAQEASRRSGRMRERGPGAGDRAATRTVWGVSVRAPPRRRNAAQGSLADRAGAGSGARRRARRAGDRAATSAEGDAARHGAGRRRLGVIDGWRRPPGGRAPVRSVGDRRQRGRPDQGVVDDAMGRPRACRAEGKDRQAGEGGEAERRRARAPRRGAVPLCRALGPDPPGTPR